MVQIEFNRKRAVEPTSPPTSDSQEDLTWTST